MTDIKISELSNVSSNETTDLFEISRDLGGGAFESKSISYDALLHSVVGQTTYTVGSEGSMFTSIGDAVDYINTYAPATSTNPVVISVQPGTYTEDSIVLPAYVCVCGADGSKSVIITASDPDNVMFTMSLNSSLRHVRLTGASGSSGAAVKSIATTFEAIVDDVVVRDCYTGFWATGATASLRCMSCSYIPFTTASENGFLVEAGGVISASNTIIRVAGSGTIVNGGRVTGSGSVLNLSTYRMANCTNGIFSDDGGLANTNSGFFDGCTNALRIGSTGSNSKIEVYAASIINSVTYDVLIESITGIVDFIGKMDYNKRSIVDGADFESLGIDEENEILKLTGPTNIEEKADIGVPGSTTEALGVGLDIGEGGSYDKDRYGVEIVEYWQYNDSAVSGSKFTRYANNAGTQLTDVGDAIIVGSKYPFSATTTDVNVAANLGGNSFIAEHWNGISWTEDAVCAYRKSDFENRGNIIFQNVETQYVEFNTTINDDWISDDNVVDEIPDWDFDGDMYAVRFRNNGGSLTTGMEFDSGKVRGDDFDITSAQKAVAFGRYRQTQKDIIRAADTLPDAVSPPANETIDLSTNISFVSNSKFVDGALSSLNFEQVIPDWADTSSGVRLLIGMYPSDATVGDVNVAVRYVNAEAPFIFDGTATEFVTSLVSTTPGVAKRAFPAINTFDISSFSPGDNFIVSIERDATAGNPLDTYAGDVTIVGLTLTWTRKIIG